MSVCRKCITLRGRQPRGAGLLILFLALFISCGLESYVYLEPVEIINNSNTGSVTITLPPQWVAEFSSYTIYYRIYLSQSNLTSVTEGTHGTINTALALDYSAVYPYTTNDSISSNSLELVFRQRNYYRLNLAEADITDVLNSSAGGVIRLDFTDSSGAKMTVNSSVQFRLYRDSSAYPRPDRNFIYTAQLANEAISLTSNADTQQKTGSEPTLNAYASMYILASGIDSNFSPIFSQPKHIGIFLLPK